jgi:predicted ArsR family transcriptional regulator
MTRQNTRVMFDIEQSSQKKLSLRAALLAVMHSGVVGTFDVIAHHAGIPAHQARTTLWDMRRAGYVSSHPLPPVSRVRAGRPRVVYGVAQMHPTAQPIDSLAFACQAWR